MNSDLYCLVIVNSLTNTVRVCHLTSSLGYTTCSYFDTTLPLLGRYASFPVLTEAGINYSPSSHYKLATQLINSVKKYTDHPCS